MSLRLSYHSFNKAKAKNCNINKNNNNNNNKDILIIIVKEISWIHREKYIKSLKKRKEKGLHWMSQTIHNLHTNQYITTKILLPLY